MALLKIVEIPDPLLKRKSAPVKEVTPEIKTLLQDMLETMYDAPGVGLAAVQVGVLKRMVVIDVTGKGEDPHPYCMINPKITDASDSFVMHEEGCLSVPDQFAEVKRHEAVTVEYTDENGNPQTLYADGLLAVCVQHELDHLDGKLFIDRLSKLKRDMIRRKVEKMHRCQESGGEKSKG